LISHQEKFINATESFFANCKPTEVTETCWIKASRKHGSYPAATKLSGKWLVFVPIEKVDEAWAVIKQATEEGKLGNWSKVATMRRNPNERDPRKKVICVYTYDSEDRADVNRVRQTLRELDFIEKLPYKTDEATMAGRHRKGDRRVSKYYE
jgi:Basophilic leukemia-expressed protein Bles03